MQINRNSPVARFNHKVGIAKSDADAIAAMQVLMDLCGVHTLPGHW